MGVAGHGRAGWGAETWCLAQDQAAACGATGQHRVHLSGRRPRGAGRGTGSKTAAPLGAGPSLPGAISQAIPPLFTSVPALQDPGTETGHRGSGQGAPSRGRARPLPCPSASSRGFYARNARSDWSAGRRGGERPGPAVHAASAETPERPLPIRGSEVNNLHPLSEAARPRLPRSPL